MYPLIRAEFLFMLVVFFKKYDFVTLQIVRYKKYVFFLDFDNRSLESRKYFFLKCQFYVHLVDSAQLQTKILTK